jgi:Matrixin
MPGFTKLVVGWVLQLGLLGAFLLVSLSYLPSCSDVGAGEARSDAPKHGSWRMLPVTLVFSDALDGCQDATMRAASTWWEVRTGKVLFNRMYVPATDPLVNGLPTQDVVAVSPSPLSAPGVLDEATVVTAAEDKNVLYSVDLRVGTCSFRAYVHELGHALGLLHSTGQGSLMRKEHAPDALELSPEELLRAMD